MSLAIGYVIVIAIVVLITLMASSSSFVIIWAHECAQGCLNIRVRQSAPEQRWPERSQTWRPPMTVGQLARLVLSQETADDAARMRKRQKSPRRARPTIITAPDVITTVALATPSLWGSAAGLTSGRSGLQVSRGQVKTIESCSPWRRQRSRQGNVNVRERSALNEEVLDQMGVFDQTPAQGEQSLGV